MYRVVYPKALFSIRLLTYSQSVLTIFSSSQFALSSLWTVALWRPFGKGLFVFECTYTEWKLSWDWIFPWLTHSHFHRYQSPQDTWTSNTIQTVQVVVPVGIHYSTKIVSICVVITNVNLFFKKRTCGIQVLSSFHILVISPVDRFEIEQGWIVISYLPYTMQCTHIAICSLRGNNREESQECNTFPSIGFSHKRHVKTHK